MQLRTGKAILATVDFGAVVEHGLLIEILTATSRPSLHAPPIILGVGATLASADIAKIIVNDILVVWDGVIQETGLGIRTLPTFV